jgi:hypothetical protein
VQNMKPQVANTGKSQCIKCPRLAVPWLRRLVAGLPPRRPGFDPGPDHVGFVVDKVALGQVFLRVLRFSPVSFIPPVLRYTEKLRKLIVFITGLHNKPQGCGASVASAAGAFHHTLKSPSFEVFTKSGCWRR